MDIAFNIPLLLEKYVKEAASTIPDFTQDFNPDIREADPRHGDFQANGVLPFAKIAKKNPRQLAEALTSTLKNQLNNIDIEVTIAGPGFINFSLGNNFLLNWLTTYKNESDFKLASGETLKGKKISIDYSSPNTAKQMHVGHLRSMVIGEAIQRILRFCGANIIRDNHIGDWGTQFGILILAIKHFQFNLDDNHQDILEALEDLYRKGNELFESNPKYQEIARQELKKLQDEDPENFNLWKKINDVSYKAFQNIYDLMNVEFDVVQGESFYRNMVDRVAQELEETNIAQTSEGALVIFYPQDNPKEKPYPFIIRKKDGASNYATTDLATALYHNQQNNVEEMIYVTDGRQQDHFKYLFKTVTNWFHAKNYRLHQMKHVWFGTILGEDGKAIKTRSGKSIKLKELLSEAIERARTVAETKNPNLDESEKNHIAQVVGLGAVRYADLAQNRSSDYMFSWDKILAFDGNTAVYLLYAVARIHSIFRKLNIEPGQLENSPATLQTPEEINLAKKIIDFPLILTQITQDLRPHVLCNFLYELAGDFSTFYNANKVITEDPQTQSKRLILCARTLAILETGLHLLGLKTLKRM